MMHPIPFSGYPFQGKWPKIIISQLSLFICEIGQIAPLSYKMARFFMVLCVWSKRPFISSPLNNTHIHMILKHILDHILGHMILEHCQNYKTSSLCLNPSLQKSNCIYQSFNVSIECSFDDDRLFRLNTKYIHRVTIF